MLDQGRLKDILHKKGLSRTDKVLVCLFAAKKSPKTVKEIRHLAVSVAGLRGAKKWNISSLLSRTEGLCARTGDGWELTADGKQHVSSLVAGVGGPPVPKIATDLTALVGTIADPPTRRFLEEAVTCFQHGLCRAAVVLSWVGAVALLQAHVVKNALAPFNQEATRRSANWKNAKTTDDLGLMKESEFLDVLQKISVIGKNVKQELQNCLTLRNGCGHPSSLRIGQQRVAAHLEVLCQNVYRVF